MAKRMVWGGGGGGGGVYCRLQAKIRTCIIVYVLAEIRGSSGVTVVYKIMWEVFSEFLIHITSFKRIRRAGKYPRLTKNAVKANSSILHYSIPLFHSTPPRQPIPSAGRG